MKLDTKNLMINAEKIRKTKPIVEIDEVSISGDEINPEKKEKAYMEALKEYDQAEDRFERAIYRFVTEENRETVLQEAEEEEERQYRQK